MPQFENVNFLLDENPGTRDLFITLSLNNVTLRQALEMILRPKGLDFIILSNTIYVSTREGCLEQEARAGDLYFVQYDVRDLLVARTRRQTAEAARRLAESVKLLTGAHNWDFAGAVDDADPAKSRAMLAGLTGGAQGPGRILLLREGYLIVNHVGRIQRMVQSVLTQLRSQERLEKPAEKRSEAERQLEAALSKKIEHFSFDEQPLAEVIGYVKTLPEFERINILPDEERLVPVDVFITAHLNNVTLRNALNLVLKPRGLDFAIWNDTIFISTEQAIRDLMPLEVRTYNVADLATPIRAGVRSGNGGGGRAANLIASTVFHVTGEANWKNVEVESAKFLEGAGNGWANVDARRGIMVVYQRAEIHDQIEVILQELRAARPPAKPTDVETMQLDAF